MSIDNATPAPWFSNDIGDIFAECQDDNEDPLASVHERHNGKTPEDILEAKSNACLMAASHELYAAVEACVKSKKLSLTLVEQCIEAMAKADQDE